MLLLCFVRINQSIQLPFHKKNNYRTTGKNPSTLYKIAGKGKSIFFFVLPGHFPPCNCLVFEPVLDLLKAVISVLFHDNRFSR